VENGGWLGHLGLLNYKGALEHVLRLAAFGMAAPGLTEGI
jgi:hypothetical protein